MLSCSCHSAWDLLQNKNKNKKKGKKLESPPCTKDSSIWPSAIVFFKKRRSLFMSWEKFQTFFRVHKTVLPSLKKIYNFFFLFLSPCFGFSNIYKIARPIRLCVCWPSLFTFHALFFWRLFLTLSLPTK